MARRLPAGIACLALLVTTVAVALLLDPTVAHLSLTGGAGNTLVHRIDGLRMPLPHAGSTARFNAPTKSAANPWTNRDTVTFAPEVAPKASPVLAGWLSVAVVVALVVPVLTVLIARRSLWTNGTRALQWMLHREPGHKVVAWACAALIDDSWEAPPLAAASSSDDILEQLLAASADEPRLLRKLELHWEVVARSTDFLAHLRQLTTQGNEDASRVLAGMDVVAARMRGTARDRLASLMQLSEMEALDEAIEQMARNSEIDIAFMQVLESNLEAAATAENPDRVRFFTYVRSRVVQTIEGFARPAHRLISRMLREEDPNARQKILEEELLPSDDDGEPEVSPEELTEAVAETVRRVEAMDAAAPLLAETLTAVRSVAAEARAVLAAALDPADLHRYDQLLAQAFRPTEE
eukprot:EG_transcript_11158